VLDETPDLRLRHYHQKYKRTLTKILDTIRLGNAAETEGLLGLIQAHASEEEIEDHIDRLGDRPGPTDLGWDHGQTRAMADVDVAAEYLQELSAPPGNQYLGRSIWQSATIDGARAYTRTSTRSSRPSLSSGPSENTPRHASRSGSLPYEEVEERRDGSRPMPNFGNLSMSKSLVTNNFPENIQQRQLQALSGRIEESLPLNLDTASRADRLSSAMLAFRDAARSMIARGQRAEDVLSMQGLDLELLYRPRAPGDPHNVSTWACEYTKTWTFLPMHVRLASVHYAGSLMRWLILPCRETYALLSKLMRPIDCQLFVPHTGDVDLCHLPCVRATQLEHGGKWVNRVTADSQRCHWVEGDISATEERVIQTSQGPVATKMLSAAFIDFVDDVRNWSLSNSVLKEFPELSGKITFHEDEKGLIPLSSPSPSHT
jgi:hypothetical protein